MRIWVGAIFRGLSTSAQASGQLLRIHSLIDLIPTLPRLAFLVCRFPQTCPLFYFYSRRSGSARCVSSTSIALNLKSSSETLSSGIRSCRTHGPQRKPPSRIGLIQLRNKKKEKKKKGYSKILGACNQARLDRLQYLWVDTNCIDKSSSAELSEAINSMYDWYSYSKVYCA